MGIFIFAISFVDIFGCAVPCDKYNIFFYFNL